MIKTLLLVLTLALSGFFSAMPSWADSGSMTDGVVRKVDSDNGKITIKHGVIPNLDMPPMSMVFTVKDVSILESIAKGDKVKFVAAEENGKLFVTEIQAAE